MSDFEPYDNVGDDELPPSKSTIKRDAEHLKKVGEKLLSLSNQQLASFPLSDRLEEAIEEGKRLKSREGLRRHKQFIGKLLRDCDSETIEAQLACLEKAHTLNTREFHHLEKMRDDLINGDNKSIGEVIARFPGIDTQKLRQLVRNAKKEQQANLQVNAQSGTTSTSTQSRKLFRFLRDENGNA